MVIKVVQYAVAGPGTSQKVVVATTPNLQTAQVAFNLTVDDGITFGQLTLPDPSHGTCSLNGQASGSIIPVVCRNLTAGASTLTFAYNGAS